MTFLTEHVLRTLRHIALFVFFTTTTFNLISSKKNDFGTYILPILWLKSSMRLKIIVINSHLRFKNTMIIENRMRLKRRLKTRMKISDMIVILWSFLLIIPMHSIELGSPEFCLISNRRYFIWWPQTQLIFCDYLIRILTNFILTTVVHQSTYFDLK